MSVNHVCPCTQVCPLQRAMEMIGGKWKLSILCSLAVDGTMRYNDLKRRLGAYRTRCWPNLSEKWSMTAS